MILADTTFHLSNVLVNVEITVTLTDMTYSHLILTFFSSISSHYALYLDLRMFRYLYWKMNIEKRILNELNCTV